MVHIDIGAFCEEPSVTCFSSDDGFSRHPSPQDEASTTKSDESTICSMSTRVASFEHIVYLCLKGKECFRNISVRDSRVKRAAFPSDKTPVKVLAVLVAPATIIVLFTAKSGFQPSGGQQLLSSALRIRNPAKTIDLRPPRALQQSVSTTNMIFPS
jgi:hypothetical protein